MNRPAYNGRQLTRTQKRVLLWLPLLGFWAVLLLVSGSEEGGRDWGSVVMMGIVGGLAYVGLWVALLKITAKPQRPADDTPKGEPSSRAALIYGPGDKAPRPESQPRSEPPGEEPPTQP
jgi:hypothetical protein